MTTWVERVNQQAKSLGLTDTRIAELCGVSRPTVSNWMNGKRVPRMEQKIKLAAALQASINWLETGEERLPDTHLPNITMEEVSEFLDAIEKQQQTFSTAASSAIKVVESAREKSFLVKLDNDTMLDPVRSDVRFIPKGATVQIDVDVQPRSDSILLVKIEGSMVLRVWQRLDDNHHSLTVINPDYKKNLDSVYEGNILDIYHGTAVAFRQLL